MTPGYIDMIIFYKLSNYFILVEFFFFLCISRYLSSFIFLVNFAVLFGADRGAEIT